MLTRVLPAALVVVLALPAAAPAAPAGQSYHSVNGQFLWDQSIVGTGAAAEAFRTAQLQGMRAEGLTLVRYGAPWSLMEPIGPLLGLRFYDWNFGDTVVSTLARQGVRWYPILGATPGWASDNPPAPPACATAAPAPRAAAATDFAAFARAFMTRYGPGGAFWRANPSLTALPVQQVEIYNEPNHGCFFNTGADNAPERFAPLYAAARSAIRAVAPATTVVAGGLAPGDSHAATRMLAPQTFVTRMLASRPALASELEAVGMHPYAPDAAGTFAQIAAMRATLDARVPKRRVPIEVTEAGWFTQGTFAGVLAPITESARATMLQTLAVELPASDCAVTRLVPHTWMSAERDPAYFHDWYGIVGRDGVKKPSALAYGAGLRAARASASNTVLDRC